MNAIVIDPIPFAIDLDDLKKKLHISSGSSLERDLEDLAREAAALAKPKALYKVAYIDSRQEEYVVVAGIRLTSRVLRVNLDTVTRIFPYVVTCGSEMESWAAAVGDMLYSYWADTIKEVALRQAGAALLAHLRETYRLGKTSAMSPGSLQDWPIQQQRPLFQLLGNVEEAIGVCLTDSLLMIPNKTVSGIRFPVEGSFESCQLCPRESCPNRRAVYEPDLYEEKYVHGVH